MAKSIQERVKHLETTVKSCCNRFFKLKEEVDNKISKSIGPTYTTNNIITLTEAEYNELEEIDPTTLYFIV